MRRRSDTLTRADGWRFPFGPGETDIRDCAIPRSQTPSQSERENSEACRIDRLAPVDLIREF
jgi:hypothetical protein